MAALVSSALQNSLFQSSMTKGEGGNSSKGFFFFSAFGSSTSTSSFFSFLGCSFLACFGCSFFCCYFLGCYFLASFLGASFPKVKSGTNSFWQSQAFPNNLVRTL